MNAILNQDPLEFKDCLNDSPDFRSKLQNHEKELDRTSQSIKALTKDIKVLVEAARNLSQAQRNLVRSLKTFAYNTSKTNQTEDEIVISKSFDAFSQIINLVEEERMRMLDCAEKQIIGPLEAFRKDHIGKAKERRKKFEKQTQKFYQSQERYLNLSTKKEDHILQEADASLDMEQRHFIRDSLEYVFLLHEVQEREKFEFVEIILSHTLSWLTFYHLGHDIYNDNKSYMTNLQERIQRTRENFFATRHEVLTLKNKMLDINDPGSMNKAYTRQGYLFLMEKKAFGTTWTKYYCYYQKSSKLLTMMCYNQPHPKMEMILKSCLRRSADSVDKRFCLELNVQMLDKDKGVTTIQTLTIQTLSEEDCKRWLDAMDGKESLCSTGVYQAPLTSVGTPRETTSLDESGLTFISRAIAILESKGLEDQGLYRLVGVSSKVSKLLALGLDPTKTDKLFLEDSTEWEVKTITSAIKQYFRNLPEPLMTYKLHCDFINAAKREKFPQRINGIHILIHKLPNTNFIVLKTLMQHLCNVSKKCDKNLMTVSNLGVCFGPTLLRPEEESVAAILDIKFCNIVVEILIEHFDKIFSSSPPTSIDATQYSKEGTATTPKSSPTLTSPTCVSSKANQPVLQTVVTSFTTSEPQTVHFGSSKVQSTSGYSENYSRGTSRLPSSVPPPPSATHMWGAQPLSNSGLNSVSSLTSLTSTGPGSLFDVRSVANNNVGSNNSSKRTKSPDRLGAPLSFLNPLSGSDRVEGSSSSSCESLTSRSSRDLLPAQTSSPKPSKRLPPSSVINGRLHHNRSSLTSINSARLGTTYPPTYRQHMEALCKRQSLEHLYSSMTTLSGSQSSSALPTLASACAVSASSVLTDTSRANGLAPIRKRVRTLYACVGENDSELSFEPNQILTNVRPSKEPGWLEGTLNGRSGLIPENYVEFIDDKGSLPTLISPRNTDV